MTRLVGISDKKTQVYVGALNKLIKIYQRSLTAPSDGSPDFTEVYTLVANPWSMVKQIKGVKIFDGSGIERVATHEFYIRYIWNPRITFEFIIQFHDQYFRILDVVDYEEKRIFTKLTCCKRGNDELPVNLS